ncbi:hypothetical protein GCM10018980_64980 [Streptomyces capoamus]|uniref:Uncharacterized protein n=1 Tax=Streptomyces capoamus TaxID=68183 RepID=A0A919F191_9ACTN|nr:hypothetical protein GCM10010501_63860 [Streptomyces libani subsp. rufus]GHG70368.1 hypothetical protein GCM10018980_64980 [Streptomyces capoamus]
MNGRRAYGEHAAHPVGEERRGHRHTASGPPPPVPSGRGAPHAWRPPASTEDGTACRLTPGAAREGLVTVGSVPWRQGLVTVGAEPGREGFVLGRSVPGPEEAAGDSWFRARAGGPVMVRSEPGQEGSS